MPGSVTKANRARAEPARGTAAGVPVPRGQGQGCGSFRTLQAIGRNFTPSDTRVTVKL